MQGMVPLSGFGGVPYSAVRKAAPRNLLDNSDFTNLVAQAGIGGNHGTIAYAADRWILDSGTVSYAAGVGLTLNGTIRQKLEFLPTGETSTFVGMASGAASIRYADGAVTITSSGGVLKWAALYGGVYSAATMPEYQPKGYGAELAECQRYFLPLTIESRFIGSTNYAGNSLTFFIPTTVKMRVKPSISSTPNIIISGSLIDSISTSVKDIASNGIICNSTFTAQSGTSRTTANVYIFEENSYLSADL